jgi:iron complex transport system substrate-binding protein
MRRLILFLLLAAPFSSFAANPRVVTIGGGVTEIVYALQRGDWLVGTDATSLYPEAAAKLPKVGHGHQVTAEGILSLKPNLLLTSKGSIKPELAQQLEQAGVKVVEVDDETTVIGTEQRINELGKVLNANDEAQKVVANLHDDLNKLTTAQSSQQRHPKVLFIYARGGGTMLVFGKNTLADQMIAISGGVNAVQSFDGYKPLTAESLAEAQPDVILMTTRGLQSMGGVDGLLKTPGISLTPAGKNQRVVTLDDSLLLAFGPRLGQAALELNQKIQ